ncbi:MAG: M1 family metallopeptidase [Myxococcota bacterium]
MRRTPLTLALLVTALGCAGQQKNTATPVTESIGPAVPVGQLERPVRPVSYRLDFTLVPAQASFSGTTTIEVEFQEVVDRFFFHGLDLTVNAARVTQGGRVIAARYAQVDPSGVAELVLDQKVSKGSATVELDYTAPFNEKLQGIYRVVDDGTAYAFSQFEAISARLAFPGFDEPAFKTPFDLSVTALSDHAVITTTPEISAEELSDGMTKHVFQTTESLPTYLLAFAVGPLDVVDWEPIPPTALRDRPIPLRGVAAKGKGDRVRFALKDTAELVTTLEAYFGMAYPYAKLDLIAAPDYAFGAMENVGAIVYREERLLLDETSPLSQRRAYLETHSHELAHQWFGNFVTPVWWTDIWLNESFASWMGVRAVTTARPDGLFDRRTLGKAIGTMKSDSLASARRIREPVMRNLEIWSAFDSITYRKGGGILAMFESFLGAETFREGVRTHMRRFPHGVADADDFSESLAQGSKRPEVIPAFRSFIEQAGVPLLTVEARCGVEGNALVVQQSRYRPLGSTIDPNTVWGVPMCFATWNERGDRTSRCELIEEESARIALEACPVAVLPNSGGQGYYHFDVGDDGFRVLFERFDALTPAEQLATYSSLDAAFRAGRVDLTSMLDGTRLAAGSKAWDVQLAPIEFLTEYAHSIAEDSAAARATINSLYADLVLDLGVTVQAKDDDADELRRQALVSLVALVGKDERVRKALLPIARRYLAKKSTTADKPVAKVALAVAAAERGDPFVTAATQRLEVERDGFARSELVFALAYVPPETLPKVTAILLGDILRVNETIRLLGHLFESDHRDAALEWMATNSTALMQRLPSQFHGRILKYPKTLCSEAALEALAGFDAKAAELQGAERALAQSKEAITLCVTLKKHVASAPRAAR